MVLVLAASETVLSETSCRARSIDRYTRSLDLAISFFHLGGTLFDTIGCPGRETVMHILILLLPDSTSCVIRVVGLVSGAATIRLVVGIAEPSLLVAVSSLLVQTFSVTLASITSSFQMTLVPEVEDDQETDRDGSNGEADTKACFLGCCGERTFSLVLC